MVEEIDAKVAAVRLAGETPPVLLDVREDQELAIVAIDGAQHIPMGDIPSRLTELDPDASIICLCHHGMRSAQVAGFLVQQGFTKVANLSGGIDAWAAVVDESMPRY
ncbi:MAG: rhodanese-like domain-containing protein [Deltaproteobacteria bacterium]